MLVGDFLALDEATLLVLSSHLSCTLKLSYLIVTHFSKAPITGKTCLLFEVRFLREIKHNTILTLKTEYSKWLP